MPLLIAAAAAAARAPGALTSPSAKPYCVRIAAAASAVSAALDESEAVGDRPYTLEVSSRGVSTPLTAVKHYRRNAGRLVKLWLTTGGDVTGRITGVTDTALTLDVDGTENTVALGDVKKAVVQVELNRSLADDDGEDA